MGQSKDERNKTEVPFTITNHNCYAQRIRKISINTSGEIGNDVYQNGIQKGNQKENGYVKSRQISVASKENECLRDVPHGIMSSKENKERNTSTYGNIQSSNGNKTSPKLQSINGNSASIFTVTCKNTVEDNNLINNHLNGVVCSENGRISRLSPIKNSSPSPKRKSLLGKTFSIFHSNKQKQKSSKSNIETILNKDNDDIQRIQRNSSAHSVNSRVLQNSRNTPPVDEVNNEDDLDSIHCIINQRDRNGHADFHSVSFEVESLYNQNVLLQMSPLVETRLFTGVPLQENQELNLESWMARLPPHLLTVPLHHLCIPGSHDSFSYSLLKGEEIGPDAPSVVGHLDACVPCIARPAILRWSVTQRATASEQLKNGIRYFDIRVAVREAKFYFVHGLYGADLQPLLVEFRNFLLKHPGEVVLLDFQHFHSLSAENHVALVHLLEEIFQDKLCPFFHHLNHLNLGYLARANYQVLVFYRHESRVAVDWLWCPKSLPNPWPNTTKINKMLSYLEDRIKNRNDDTFFVTQCVLTPTNGYLLRNWPRRLEFDMALPCNAAMLEWLQDLYPGPFGPNIMMADFVDMDHWTISRDIIKRNWLNPPQDQNKKF